MSDPSCFPSLDSLPPLKDLLKSQGLWARKSLGQNFLLDMNLITKIARQAGDLTSCTVIEIGPGPGGLTRALLSLGAKKVIALEQDPRCVKALQSLVTCSSGRLQVIQTDALAVDLSTLTQGPIKVVANLPYNIATPLLLGWMRYASVFESLTLMFQKEVADRLTAPLNTKAYGRLSVMVQWRCRVQKSFDIPPEAFVPAPKVTSTVVHLVPYPKPLYACDPEKLAQVVKTAFQHRRKMIRSSLKPLFSDLENVLLKQGISPEKRAENLSLQDFCALAVAF